VPSCPITGTLARIAARRHAIRIALDARDQLGEGPHWDPEQDELIRVDIRRGLLHRWCPADGTSTTTAVDGELGAVVPRTGGGAVLAVDRTLVLEDPDGARRTVAAVDEPADNRFNDCRADAAGRLWAGTMSRSRRPGTAALHRLAPGGALEVAIAGTTLSNGIGWSADGERMFFVDSTTQRIDVLDFDAATGAVSGRRALAAIDPADGLPDGLAVDAEDGVWICLFGGAAVRRYDAAGNLDAVVALPVTNPTCPAFGGPGLATLYVTSARHRLTAEQLAAEPHAGAVLALEPGVAGLPRGTFAG
jgi:sugar lactone lactonase YvrE